MADPIWYLGVPGDLRPLVCPEGNIDITPVRYGPVRQAISGATSMDVTGIRQKFVLDLRWLEPDDWKWLEALNLTQGLTLRGPFRLLNPLKANRLTPESSYAVVQRGTQRGIQTSWGIFTRVFDWPSAAGTLGAMSTKWTGRPVGTSYTRFDERRRTTCLAGETLRPSVYLKASVGTTVNFFFDWYDRSGLAAGSSSLVPVSVTTSWARYQSSVVVPAGATTCRLIISTTDTAPDIYIAAAQVEAGSAITPWEIGGGGPEVAMTDINLLSPRFGYYHATLTLMET